MIKSFFRLAVRSLIRDKYTSFVFFLLLLAGMSSFAIILSVYRHEIRHDHFLKDSDRIYRLTTYFVRGTQEVKWAITNGHLPTLLKERIPEVENAIKFQTIQQSMVVEASGKKFHIPERQGFYADPDFLDVLAYPLLYGDPKTVLEEPQSIVLSEAYAQRFFGRKDVVGEALRQEDEKGRIVNFKVTGVLKKIPSNSHLKFEVLMHGSNSRYWNRFDNPRNGYPVHVYFKTVGHPDMEIFAAKLEEETRRTYVNANGEPRNISFPIQPLREIHFNADNLFEPGAPGNRFFSRVLMAVGLVVLIIATVNFCLLFTTKSMARAKEIGIRKTLGASKQSISMSMMAEPILLCFSCAVLSLFFAELVLQRLVVKFLFEADLMVLNATDLIVFMLVSGIVLGIISGLYVSVKSSTVSPSEILRGRLHRGKLSLLSGKNLLIIFQFIMTSVLITASLVFIKQTNFIQLMDAGYEKEGVIRLVKPANMTNEQLMAFRAAVVEESSVAGAGFSYYKLIGNYNAGLATIIHQGDTFSTRGQATYMDPGLIEALDLEFIAGRNFDETIPSDSSAVILNETAVKKLGIKEPVGKILQRGRWTAAPPKVVGVVKDFHYQSFLSEVPPLIISNFFSSYTKKHIMIRFVPGRLEEGLQRVEQTWLEMSDGIPFEPSYLDDSYAGLVNQETRLNRMIVACTILSVIMACLGLVALVRHTNQQRQKEIGIRKVYGASISDVMKMVGVYFGKLIAFSLLIAIPLSVFGINKWLETFAYKTDQSFREYLITASLLVGLSLLITNFQTLKTARSNPTEVLKEE